MGKPVDLILGSIRNLETDRLSGWNAFYLTDKVLEKVHKELREAIAERDELRRKIQKLIDKHGEMAQTRTKSPCGELYIRKRPRISRKR